MVQQTNEFMEKTLFKDFIKYDDYTPILIGIDMMGSPARIEQVKAEIRKRGKQMMHKRKIQ